MDAELVWYKKEIEKRFKASTFNRSYVMERRFNIIQPAVASAALESFESVPTEIGFSSVKRKNERGEDEEVKAYEDDIDENLDAK